MSKHEQKLLADLCRIEIRRWQSVPDKQYMVDLLELALASLESPQPEPVADEKTMLAEQAKAVIHCLDMCEVPEGDYADNPQLKLWGRVIEYGRLPAPVVPDGWEACSPEWIDRNGPCSCANAPRLAFGSVGQHYHPHIFIDNTAKQYEALAGWKMVPIEPTAAMYDAGDKQLATKQVWDAMLAAAPKPEA